MGSIVTAISIMVGFLSFSAQSSTQQIHFDQMRLPRDCPAIPLTQFSGLCRHARYKYRFDHIEEIEAEKRVVPMGKTQVKRFINTEYKCYLTFR